MPLPRSTQAETGNPSPTLIPKDPTLANYRQALEASGMDQYLLNSYPGLIIPYVAFHLPFAVWILRNSLLDLPHDLEEAATVDGAGPTRTLLSVILPQARPALFTAGVFTFTATWVPCVHCPLPAHSVVVRHSRAIACKHGTTENPHHQPRSTRVGTRPAGQLFPGSRLVAAGRHLPGLPAQFRRRRRRRRR
jgi:hypothetical protein